MRPAAAYAGVALGLALLAGCGSSGSGLPHVLTAAPEPARAPAAQRDPAGRVVTLPAADPEGVVVDAAGTVAVAVRRPSALVLLDSSTLAVQRTVTVAGSARHLELAGDRVFVPGEDTDLVSTVGLPDGDIEAEVKVGRQPHDLAELGSTLVVADELGGAVSAIDERTGRVTTLPGPVQPGGVAAAAGRAGVVDVRGRLLYVYQPVPLSLLARVPIGAGPTHAVAVGGGLVVVADTSGGALLVVQLTGKPAVVARIVLPGQPYGLAFDAVRRILYAATGSDNTLHAYKVDGSTLTAGGTWPTVQQPNSLAVVPSTGRILVAGATTSGTLEAIDP